MSPHGHTHLLGRRAFLKGLGALAVLWAWPARLGLAGPAVSSAPRAAALAASAPAPGALPLAAMVGERLSFNIAFWIFSAAGKAEMTLKALRGTRPGFYEAFMGGQTSGVIGFFTRYRKDTYRSAMQLVDGRLRPLEFQEEVIIGQEVRRRRTTTFDYASGTIIRRKSEKGGAVKVEQLKMKPGVVYDDYLSGLYNIRSGAYGPMRGGKTYVLNVPKKEGKITLALAQREETRQRLSQEGPPGEKTFFCRIFMPKEDLGSGTGRLEGWFSGQGVPLMGVVEDVALLGDVRGTLLSREVPRQL